MNHPNLFDLLNTLVPLSNLLCFEESPAALALAAAAW